MTLQTKKMHELYEECKRIGISENRILFRRNQNIVCKACPALSRVYREKVVLLWIGTFLEEKHIVFLFFQTQCLALCH